MKSLMLALFLSLVSVSGFAAKKQSSRCLPVYDVVATTYGGFPGYLVDGHFEPNPAAHWDLVDYQAGGEGLPSVNRRGGMPRGGGPDAVDGGVDGSERIPSDGWYTYGNETLF